MTRSSGVRGSGPREVGYEHSANCRGYARAALRDLRVMESAMHKLFEPTKQPGWVLSHEGYNVLTESAVESRFAFGNGFLGMRAARSVSRGPTWTSWLGYLRWASWPRCYVAGLFDIPNVEPPVPAL